MAREIINQLFDKNQAIKNQSEVNFQLSVKEWKELTARIDKTQLQIQAHDEKIDTLYSKFINWMKKIKDKVDTLSNACKASDTALKELKHILQKQKQETSKQIQSEHEKTVNVLKQYNQFIQNYDENLNTVKDSISKNKRKMLQLLGEINVLHMEMSDTLKQQKPRSPASLHQDPKL